ncbi:uncharacterized protein LOC135689062 [Rhopilema esculentum]|uniref:uncharacterized protein LOC135689062 n=1 Tax=Rhopilema esculentum TaxID=499914 RepID=UPI0031DAC113|eukprot:gene7825-13691_t
MNYSFLLSLLACVLFASTASADCDGALPSDVCKRLETLEKNMKSLATKSVLLVTKAVATSAQKNADLFAKTIELIKDAKPKQGNGTNITKLIEEVEQKFKAIEGSRTQMTKNAIKSIQGAAAKIANLIEKIIEDAADGDHSDLDKLKRRIKVAVTAAHLKIKGAAFRAIRSVQQSNAIIERYVVNVLKKLGISEAGAAASFVDAVSAKEDMELADAAEKEMEADFDSIADGAYDLVAVSNDKNVKRGLLQDFWNRIKSKLVALKDIIMEEIKKAIAIMWPQIKEKLTEVVQIILNTAKQAIVNIAGQMVLVTVPSSIL